MGIGDLHVSVALEEVGDFGFAVLGVSGRSGGGGATSHEVSFLGVADFAALVGPEELLDGGVSVNSLHVI